MTEYESFLTIMADKLGIAVEKLWDVTVAQALISGISAIFTIIIWFLITVAAIRFVMKKTTASEKDGYPDWDSEGAGFAWAGVCCMGFIFILISTLSMSTILAAFLNPEYWALMQLKP